MLRPIPTTALVWITIGFLALCGGLLVLGVVLARANGTDQDEPENK